MTVETRRLARLATTEGSLARCANRARHGSALLMALVLLVVVSILAAGYLQVLSSTTRNQSHETESMKAFYLAEAGLAEAFHAVRIGRTGQVGTAELPAQYGDGLLWVDSEATGEGYLRLESTGMVGGGRSKLALIVEPTELELGFFSDDDLVVESVLLVDGFDSTEAAYSEQVVGGSITVDPSYPYLHVDPVNDLLFYESTFYRIYGADGDTYYFDRAVDVLTISEDPAYDEYEIAWDDFIDSPLPGDFADQEYDGVLAYFAALAAEEPPVATETPEGVGPTTAQGGLLGSNGGIVLGSSGDPVTVFGDVVPGPDGTLTLGAGGEVTGDTDARALLIDLPPVQVPEVAWRPETVHDEPVPLVVPAGSVGYPHLEVAADAEALVRGPATVVVGDLVLQPGAVLTLDTVDGPVELYVTGGMDLAPDSVVVTSERPEDLAVQVAPIPTAGGVAPVQLHATSRFHGTIYSPETEVEIGSEFEIFGAVIAKRLVIGPGARLHYDNSGQKHSSLPTLMSWRIIELPGQVKSNLWSPYATMGVEKQDLPPLSTAHVLDDVWLELTYANLSGAEHSYSGWEAEFDWLSVGKVLEVKRQKPSDDASTVTDPVDPISPADQTLLDLIATEPSSSVLRDELNAQAPLSGTVLLAALLREPPLTSGDLLSVLETSGPAPLGVGSAPLPDDVLVAAVDELDLTDNARVDVLVQNSPLSAPVLDALAVREPPLGKHTMDLIMAAQ